MMLSGARSGGGNHRLWPVLPRQSSACVTGWPATAGPAPARANVARPAAMIAGRRW